MSAAVVAAARVENEGFVLMAALRFFYVRMLSSHLRLSLSLSLTYPSSSHLLPIVQASASSVN